MGRTPKGRSPADFESTAIQLANPAYNPRLQLFET